MARNREKYNAYFRKYYQTHKHLYTSKALKWKNRQEEWFYETYKDKLVCIECGEKDLRCLDFHHRNPNKKEGSISKMIRNAGRERLIEEIEKCDVLCANCHRKFHNTRKYYQKFYGPVV